jgi:hypothetical protein
MLIRVRLMSFWEMRMSFRFITGVAVAMALVSTPALACKGPNVIFNDDFASENPSWVGSGEFTVSGGRGQFKSNPGEFAVLVNEGDRFEAGDLCVDIIAPDYKGGGNDYAGVLFGFKDMANFHAFYISPPDGMVGVTAKKAGKWVSPVPARKSDALKQQSGAVNTVRLTWKGADVTAYVNDKLFLKFKVQPVADAYFGLYGQTDGKAWQFDNYKITD